MQIIISKEKKYLKKIIIIIMKIFFKKLKFFFFEIALLIKSLKQNKKLIWALPFKRPWTLGADEKFLSVKFVFFFHLLYD